MLRSAVIARTGSLWPYASVPYSQSTRWHGEYRQDCSGFVSGLWALPTDAPGSWGGYSTVTLLTQGLITEIPASDLKPGDAIGICGPQSGGNAGHIMLFEAWYNHVPSDNRCWIWEQAGGVNGPRRRLIDYPFGAYRSWRFTGIQDDPTTFLRRAWPSYMGPTDYFGDINGPNQSHGGYFALERPDCKAIQQRLIALGFVPGVTNVTSAWADGIIGPNTIKAIMAWQTSHALTPDGRIYRGHWEILFTY